MEPKELLSRILAIGGSSLAVTAAAVALVTRWQIAVVTAAGLGLGVLLVYAGVWASARLALRLPAASPTEIDGLRAEVQGMRQELHNLQDERNGYEEALQRVIERSPRPLREKYEVTCFIGESEEGDQTLETWETTAVEDGQPVMWHKVAAGVKGEGIPPKHAFRQLEDVYAGEFSEGKDRPLRVLSLGREPGRVWALINFDAEIRSDSPRKWWISYHWPGVWNQLRRDRSDHYWLDLPNGGVGVEWELVIVRFVFPTTARDPEVTVSGLPGLLQETSTDERYRKVFSFRVENPPVRLYRFDLRVQSFDATERIVDRASSPRASSHPTTN
jgi:hypothetical protein